MSRAAAELVTYPCGRCGVALMAEITPAPPWLRCPHCGRGGLPPFPSTLARLKAVAAQAKLGSDVLVIGDDAMEEPEVPWFGSTSTGANPGGVARPRARVDNTAAQTGLTLGFALCVCLFVLMLFFGDNFIAGLFGVAAGVLLLLLVRPGGFSPPPRPPDRSV